MYAVAECLTPELLYRLARATYAEMALAGITAVGEFHYVHHQADGTPYDDPNAMGLAVIRAASDAGIRITLLDTCYLQADVSGSPLAGVQRRFDDGSWQQWAARVALLSDGQTTRIGAAIHSVRAVPRAALGPVAIVAAERDAPLHVHLSEQPAENEACMDAHGMTPTAVLAAESSEDDWSSACDRRSERKRPRNIKHRTPAQGRSSVGHGRTGSEGDSAQRPLPSERRSR